MHAYSLSILNMSACLINLLISTLVLCKTLKEKRSVKLRVSEAFLSFRRGNVKMSRAALTAVGQVYSVLERARLGLNPEAATFRLRHGTWLSLFISYMVDNCVCVEVFK